MWATLKGELSPLGEVRKIDWLWLCLQRRQTDLVGPEAPKLSPSANWGPNQVAAKMARKLGGKVAHFDTPRRYG